MIFFDEYRRMVNYRNFKTADKTAEVGKVRLYKLRKNDNYKKDIYTGGQLVVINRKNSKYDNHVAVVKYMTPTIINLEILNLSLNFPDNNIVNQNCRSSSSTSIRITMHKKFLKHIGYNLTYYNPNHYMIEGFCLLDNCKNSYEKSKQTIQKKCYSKKILFTKENHCQI